MTAPARDPDPALLEQLLLGQLPPDEVERLCAEYADDQGLSALAERIGPGDPLLDTVRAQARSPETQPDPRVERLIARLLLSVPPADRFGSVSPPDFAPKFAHGALRFTGVPAARATRIHLADNYLEGGLEIHESHAAYHIERNHILGWWGTAITVCRTAGSTTFSHNVVCGRSGIFFLGQTSRPDPGYPWGAARVANNTIDAVEVPVGYTTGQEAEGAGKIPGQASIYNNLLWSRNGRGIEVPAGQLTAVRGSWSVGNNAYPKAPGPVAFPLQPSDLTLESPFPSMDPRARDRFRIASDGPLATRGTGGELPKYIGALSPGPAPKDGDWFTRLREVASAPFAWPADALREGRVAAPDLSKAKPLIDETFADPRRF